MRFIKAFITNVPMLAEMVERTTAESITLNNDIIVEVSTASFRSVRGFTVVACLLDEIAFFRTDDASTNSDAEIVAAVRPAMSTIPNAMLLASSSPYSRRGSLFEAHKQHFAKDHDPILVVQADTRTVNPVVDEKIVADAFEADPARASAEYGAKFRSDCENYIAREIVEACTPVGRFEIPYRTGPKFAAFVDAAGGAGTDSFSVAVACRDADTLLLCAIRETRPPFNPEAVIAQYAAMLRSYHITRVTGDRFSGQFVVEAFRRNGIRYETSTRNKSELYASFLPLLTARKCELLDHLKLLNQIVGLERRTTRGSGKDNIDHSPGGHDDLSNACAAL
jgi:hypothetical protein